MDLTRFDVKSASTAGADLHLVNPMTGEKIGTDEAPVSIRVIGRDSPVVRDTMSGIERRKTRGENIDREEEGLELLCAVVVGWEGIEFDGKPLEFSKENARKIFSDPRTEWVGEQVGPFALSRRNFVRNLSKD